MFTREIIMLLVPNSSILQVISIYTKYKIWSWARHSSLSTVPPKHAICEVETDADNQWAVSLKKIEHKI